MAPDLTAWPAGRVLWPPWRPLGQLFQVGLGAVVLLMGRLGPAIGGGEFRPSIGGAHIDHPDRLEPGRSMPKRRGTSPSRTQPQNFALSQGGERKRYSMVNGLISPGCPLSPVNPATEASGIFERLFDHRTAVQVRLDLQPGAAAESCAIDL